MYVQIQEYRVFCNNFVVAASAVVVFLVVDVLVDNFVSYTAHIHLHYFRGRKPILQWSLAHPASIISAQTKALVPSSRDPSHGPTLFITVVTDSFRLWVLDLKRCNYWAISPSQLLSIWPPGKQIVRRVEGEDFFFFFLGGGEEIVIERERQGGRAESKDKRGD